MSLHFLDRLLSPEIIMYLSQLSLGTYCLGLEKKSWLHHCINLFSVFRHYKSPKFTLLFVSASSRYHIIF